MGNWFTSERSSKQVTIVSSDIQTEIKEFVIGCLVKLYEGHLAADYNSPVYKEAIRSLKYNEWQRTSRRRKCKFSDTNKIKKHKSS